MINTVRALISNAQDTADVLFAAFYSRNGEIEAHVCEDERFVMFYVYEGDELLHTRVVDHELVREFYVSNQRVFNGR